MEGKVSSKSKTQHLVSLSLKWGVIAGLVIIGVFLLAKLFIDTDAGNTAAFVVRYSKFLFLGIVLYYATREYKYHYKEAFRYAQGIILAFGVSTVAATIVAIGDAIVYLINPDTMLEPFYTSQYWFLSVVLASTETATIGGIILGVAITALFQRGVEKDVND